MRNLASPAESRKDTASGKCGVFFSHNPTMASLHFRLPAASVASMQTNSFSAAFRHCEPGSRSCWAFCSSPHPSGIIGLPAASPSTWNCSRSPSRVASAALGARAGCRTNPTHRVTERMLNLSCVINRLDK